MVVIGFVFILTGNKNNNKLKIDRIIFVLRELIMPHVFISYVRENKKLVDNLCEDLCKNGIEVWMDRDQIQLGQRWQDAIRQAIKEGAFFIACISKESQRKDSTYMNEEIILAIEELRKRPTNKIWFIPVLLNTDEIPERSIGGGETLRDLHHVSLKDDWEKGIQSIVKVISPKKNNKAQLKINNELREFNDFSFKLMSSSDLEEILNLTINKIKLSFFYDCIFFLD